jgi:hypothetical protein
MIRLTVIAAAAALLLSPLAAQACTGAGAHAAKAVSTDYAAKTKKKKHVRKAAKVKKEKIEYMRAAPMK